MRRRRSASSARTRRRSRQVVLGEKFFNKIRGKGIAIHSQALLLFAMLKPQPKPQPPP